MLLFCAACSPLWARCVSGRLLGREVAEPPHAGGSGRSPRQSRAYGDTVSCKDSVNEPPHPPSHLLSMLYVPSLMLSLRIQICFWRPSYSGVSANHERVVGLLALLTITGAVLSKSQHELHTHTHDRVIAVYSSGGGGALYHPMDCSSSSVSR